jgi:hydrogenase-4 component B
MTLLAAALLVLLGSGLAALATLRWPGLSSRVGALGAPLAALLAGAPVGRALFAGETSSLELRWGLPGATLSLGIDPLSAFFLVPVLGLSALGAIYGRAYLSDRVGIRWSSSSWFFFNVLCAAMIAVTLARDAILFLVAWETMSLCAFVLVSLDWELAEARRAGWIYLIASHAGTAALLALFVLLGDSFGGGPGAALVSGRASAGILFALALGGFGVKAGIFPLHVWLPDAHAAAPSHVSALMSGAMVKLGYYGLLRVAILLGGVAWELGLSLAALGLGGAVVGIALSLTQRDLKRALAHSSVENLGLIGLGLGLGLAGSARGDATLAGLGLAAGLFHVWNHAAMKGLMFFSAGGVQHGTGTRDLERLGGLSRRMPAAALLFALAAVALAALPPLNGFATEWLLYLGLLHGVTASPPGGSVAASVALAMLALVGALAAAGFVRLFGMVFLGQARSDSARRAHDIRGSMLGVMVGLAAVCVGLGLAPALALRAVAPPLAELAAASGVVLVPAAAAEAIAPLPALALALWLAGGLVAAALALRLRRVPHAQEETWGCGYAAPAARMQYSALSFSQPFTTGVPARALAPRVRTPQPRDLFPPAGALRADYTEPIAARVYEPLFESLASRFAWLRGLQQGNIQLYLAYITFAALAALAWVSLSGTFQP